MRLGTLSVWMVWMIGALRSLFVLISTGAAGYRHVYHTHVKEAYDAAGKDDFVADCVRIFDLV